MPLFIRIGYYAGQNETFFCTTLLSKVNKKKGKNSMQLIRKKETDQFNIYENMADQELFLMIRDDLLHSKTGIRLEEILEKNVREKFRKEVKDYIHRIYRISDAKMCCVGTISAKI